MPQDASVDDAPSFVTLLTVCCLVTFGCYLAVSMRLPVLPLLAREMGVSTAAIGVINAAFYLAAGLFSIPSGALSDRFGSRRVAVTGSVALCAGMLLLSFGGSFFPLAGLYLLIGGGTAAFGATMMAWVAAVSPPTHLGRAYGWYTTALFSGMGLGPAIGGLLGRHLGLEPVFAVGAAMVAVNLWAVHRFLPPGAGAFGASLHRRPWRADLAHLLANRPLIGCWAATFGSCTMSGMFFSYFPLHAADRGLGVDAIGAVFLVQSVSNALSRIPFGAFSDRVGRRMVQALAGIVLVTVSIGGFAPAKELSHFMTAALALGVSNAVAFTSIGALIAEKTDPPYRGLAMGGYNACIYFGLMTGSIGLGPVIEAIGFSDGFLLTSLLNLPFVAVFAWSMPGHSR
jgi:MFS family permease